jgi:hypothetical protein
MKNLHLVPTDKLSRLYKTGNFLLLDSKAMPNNTLETINQHIYITSHEEIKEGDWFFQVNTKKRIKHHSKNGLFLQPQSFDKKIILTTDQDLIANGVQNIDEEFLKWFVKNPSCESVKIESWETKGEWNLDYKIIIPQEEPKALTKLEIAKNIAAIGIDKEKPKQEYYCKACGISQDEPFGKCHESHKHCSCEIRLTEEPKQETLEEAAVKEFNDFKEKNPIVRDSHVYPYKLGFLHGAKWQSERMYSEIDLEVAFFEGRENSLTFIEWFNQFKK